jgi:hypothetical protein
MADERPGPKPATFGEAIREMSLSPDEEDLLERKKSAAADRGFSSVEDYEADERRREREAAESPLAAKAADPGDPNEIPKWALIPGSLRFPIGRQVGFFRFLSDWTTRPDKGTLAGEDDPFPPFRGKLFRQCILWSLSIADEKLARAASAGDPLAVVGEMSKRMIRAIDGNVVDWSTGAVNREQATFAGSGKSASVGRESHVPTFWEEIGPGCRQLVTAHYYKTHMLDRGAQEAFFMHCCVVRSAVAG